MEMATRTASDVWRLDLATLQWELIPALVTARIDNACCAVGSSVAVVGGRSLDSAHFTATANVEVLPSREGAAFVSLPPLSCGGICGAAAIAVEESDSAAGQVLLLGGVDSSNHPLSTVQLVDLATGVCTPQSNLLRGRICPAAARLPDGRIVCAGGSLGESSVEIWGPPGQGAQDAAWTWTELPVMSTVRDDCRGCVMSDGRFAVLGRCTNDGWIGAPISSCEALTVVDSTHCEPLPPMHHARRNFACAAVAGCIIVAGRRNCQSAAVFDKVLGRWLRLPHDLPHVSHLGMSGASL
jgi:hypothetical protein